MAKKKTTPPQKQSFNPWTVRIISIGVIVISLGLIIIAIKQWNPYYIGLFLGITTLAVFLLQEILLPAHKEKVLIGVFVALVFVVIISFLMPETPGKPTFPLTVYVHGSKGQQDIVLKNKGEVMIDLGNERQTKNIREKGDAYFPAIPSEFYNKSVSLSVIAEGFESAKKEYELKGESLYVEIKPDDSLAKVFGTVRDTENNFLKDVTVRIGDLQAVSDKNGAFSLDIPLGKQKIQQTITAHKEGYEIWEAFVYPGTGQEVKITLNKK